MVVARTRSERLRAIGAASLAALYLLAFIPLLLRGPAVYLEWWIVPQMFVGVAALWLNPRDLPRRSRGGSARRARELPERALAPRP